MTDVPLRPSAQVYDLRPPPLSVLRGCGCLLIAGAVLSVASIVIALVSARFDVGSLVALVAILHWSTIVRNMKRLHGQPTLLEKAEDAEESTYRSESTERAFRVTAFYLPVLVIAVSVLKGLFEGGEAAVVTLVTGAPTFLGIFTLAWRRKFRAIRFQQIQNARDDLADTLIEVASATLSQSNHPFGNRIFYLYLRPFSSTGGLLAIPKDAVIRASVDLETRLADAVAFWGPLVALGRPGEARGAGRKLVSEGDWKLAVEQSGALASTILILPSTEQGIGWEIHLVRQNSWLDRTIFVQPPRSRQFTDDWWQMTRRLLRAEGLESPADLSKDRMAFYTLLDDGSIDQIEYCSITAGIGTIRQALVQLGE